MIFVLKVKQFFDNVLLWSMLLMVVIMMWLHICGCLVIIGKQNRSPHHRAFVGGANINIAVDVDVVVVTDAEVVAIVVVD